MGKLLFLFDACKTSFITTLFYALLQCATVLPIMAYRRRLWSIPYRRASYPIANCSCQNVIGGGNRQHVRQQGANND